MFKRLIHKTKQKITTTIARGKRKSHLLFPGTFKPGADRKAPSERGNVQEQNSGKNPAEIGTRNGEDERETEKRLPKKKRWSLDNFEVTPEPGKMRFHDINLPMKLMRAIADLNFRYCTPIQAESLPHLLKGSDLVGNANTGTGKSAVFLITIIARLLARKAGESPRKVQALIIAPTRELVIQIAKDGRKLARYANTKIAAVYGGSDYSQQMELLQKGRTEIVVATPGRLLDFSRKGIIDLQHIKILVIDEADRMLDMGFIPDVRRIINQLPKRQVRQTLMFSATITDEVKRLASQWCRNPINVAIEPEQVAVGSVEQKIYLVTSPEKYSILYNLIAQNKEGRIAVFANQKIEAKKLSERLQRNGIICALLTGDVPQKKRLDRLERFRSGKVRVLVATDVAGRGIHIEGITHVVNYSLPYEPEDYVHRIGRTGRAGAAGISISFACEEGSFILPEIEEFIGEKLECIIPEEELLREPPKGQKVTTKKYHHGRRRGKKKQGGKIRAVRGKSFGRESEAPTK